MRFHAKWIYYQTGEYKDLDAKYGNPSPYFRKTFSVCKPVKKATLTVSALGVFKVYVNGKEAADDYLSPGWVDYSKKLPYITYDVTDKLTDLNAVGIVLGDGWAVGHVGSTSTFKRNCYNDRIELMAELLLEYSDGTAERIETDRTWKAHDGAIRRSDIYMGEYIDARLSVGDFSLYSFDDFGWDEAKETEFRFSRNLYLQKSEIPLTVVKHRFEPMLVKSENGSFLYHFGQNIAGAVRCRITGERGTKLIFRYGEMLENGKLYTKNLRKAEATDTYILSGNKDEIFRPLFTYHGFEYMEVTVEGKAEISDIVGESMYTDIETTGDFSCSDEVVSKVFRNALWGQRDNFISVPTDCPQRDERLGWTGDAEVFCQSAMYNMDCRAFYKKYLADIRDAQLGNGAVPAVAPLPYVGYRSYTGRDAAAGWSEAIMIIPYVHYKMYGDLSVLRDNLPAAERLFDYYENETGGTLRDGDDMYGDWLSVGEETDKGLVANIYYAYAAFLIAEMCSILGDRKESYYRTVYERIRADFRSRYLCQDGRLLSDTQSAYVMSYRFGLITAEETKDNLVRTVTRADCHLTTGFLGVKYLLPVLCDLGRSDLAYTVMTGRTYPGWGYSVVNGATTIWERWNSYTKENGINNTSMNSFNHYSLGSCAEWMYEYCLGLRPDVNIGGLKNIALMPYFDLSGKITWAKGSYKCDFGEIRLSWNREGDLFHYYAFVPPEINVSFSFPGIETVKAENDGKTAHFVLKRAE